MRVRRHIAQLRRPCQQRHQSVRPDLQLYRVRIVQRELILSAGGAVIHRKILHGLQGKLNACNATQAVHDAGANVRRVHVSRAVRLQVDLHATAVQCRVGAIYANGRGEALYGRIFQNQVRQFLLTCRHHSERCGLRRLCDAL